MNRLLPLVLIAAVSVLTSCAGDGESGEYRPIDASGWAYGDTVKFVISTEDTLSRGDLALVIRHSASYAYSNIWLEISYPEAGRVMLDTLNVELADVYGHWHGRGLGLSYQLADTIKRDLELCDSAVIGIRHIMRVEKLEGIEQLGVVFSKK